MFVSLTEVALSTSTQPPTPASTPLHALARSQFAWKQSRGVTGWMLGNRKSCNTENRRESNTAQSGSKNQKKGEGGGIHSITDCVLGMLMRQGAFFPPLRFGFSKWTNKQHRGCVGDLYSACPQSEWARDALKIQCLHYFTCTTKKRREFFRSSRTW